jgi:hypothetical protein
VTPAALRRIIRTWQKRLKMEHIIIEVDLDIEPQNENALASVAPHEMYDRANMNFEGSWVNWTPFELNRVVVHELLHILFRDYNNAVTGIGQAGILSHQVQSLWNDTCNNAEEALIDRLAHRLVELGGVVQ